VQVVADIDGSVISLSGTDRSICIKGRRVIAEGPPAAVPAPLLARMETHAVEFSRLVSPPLAQNFAGFERNPSEGRRTAPHPRVQSVRSGYVLAAYWPSSHVCGGILRWGCTARAPWNTPT
jgi:hypothetical protein